MRVDVLTQEMDIPEGVTIEKSGKDIVVKGPKGEVRRPLFSKRVEISIKDGKATFTAKKASKREKSLMGTFRAHMGNMCRGVTEGHTYKLKICSGHFPMNVSVKGTDFVVKNFFGEKVPRTIKIREGAKIKVDGTTIEIESLDKEIAGQTAAAIEQLTRRPGFDSRIFQDGIHIIEKDGKVLS